MVLSYEKYDRQSAWGDDVLSRSTPRVLEERYLGTSKLMREAMSGLMANVDVDDIAGEAGVPASSVISLRNKGFAPLPDMIAITNALGVRVAVYPAVPR
jgi:hypothetical protein